MVQISKESKWAKYSIARGSRVQWDFGLNDSRLQMVQIFNWFMDDKGAWVKWLKYSYGSRVKIVQEFKLFNGLNLSRVQLVQ